MIKIAVLSNSPGSANTILPIVNLLNERLTIHFDLFLCPVSKKKIPKINNSTLFSISEVYIASFDYDLIVTGTSYPPTTEIFTWKKAKRFSVPTIAMIDQWLNYLERFEVSNQQLVEESLPDLITTIDNFGKSEMKALGFPGVKILSVGSPYLDTIPNANSANKALNKKNKLEILFVSEPRSLENELNHGYDEFSILEHFIIAINEQPHSIDFNIKIKPHPRNSKESFKNFIQKHNNQNISIEDKLSPRESISNSDIVIGMSSMMLVESVLMGKPTMSIQIGLNGIDPFILSRMKVMNTALSRDEILLNLNLILEGFSVKWEKPKNNIESLYSWITSKLNTN